MKLRRAESAPSQSSVLRVKGVTSTVYIDPNCGCPKIKKSTTK